MQPASSTRSAASTKVRRRPTRSRSSSSAATGIEFRLQVDPRTVPLYLYKTLERFTAHMDKYVRQTLREGLFGWQVTDCTVTMTRCNYSVADGPLSRRGPTSTTADFRKLPPLVLMQALERAGTAVCEPTLRVSLEIPVDTIGAVTAASARHEPVAGDQPSRRRTTPNPLNLNEYMTQLSGCAGVRAGASDE